MPIPLLIIAIGLVLVTALWPWICNFFQETLIPFARDTLGDGIAKHLTDLVAFLDTKVTPVRAVASKAIRAFKQTVLGMKTTYQKDSANQATATTESYVRDQEKVFRVTATEKVGWEDLPPEIRAAMIKQQTKTGTLDQMPVIDQAIQDRAREANMLDVAMA